MSHQIDDKPEPWGAARTWAEPETPERIAAKSAVHADSLQHFPSGATRSIMVAGSAGKPIRYDLIPGIAVRRWAETMAEGAETHGARNWERGLPTGDTFSRAVAHLYAWVSGDQSEDHLGHAMANIGFLMHFEETKGASGRIAAALSDQASAGAGEARPVHSEIAGYEL